MRLYLKSTYCNDASSVNGAAQWWEGVVVVEEVVLIAMMVTVTPDLKDDFPCY